MVYKEFNSHGSTLLPKIIGSYEFELHDVIHEIIMKNYSDIWDIGCAEGYYAVGLAIKSQSSKIIAFDVDDEAKKACNELIIFNNVQDRVTVEGFCRAEMINRYDFKDGLIISDCEGYELELFSNVNISNKKLDYLIEVHEWPLENEFAKKLYNLFNKTHHIKIIISKTDLHKAHHYAFEPFVNNSKISLKDKYDLYKEGRGEEMQWFYCIRKQI